MLEAIGDAKGLAWVPDWPAQARIWIALPSGREHCFIGMQGSRGRPKLEVICCFWALLYIVQYKTISNKTRKVDYHKIEGPVGLDSPSAAWWHPPKRGRWIYTCKYIYVCVYIYIYIYH